MKREKKVERTSFEFMIPIIICMKYFHITCQQEMLDIGLLNRYFYKKLHIFSYLTESTHILFTKKPKQSSGKQTPTPPFRTPFISQIFPHKTLSCKMITARIVMHMPPPPFPKKDRGALLLFFACKKGLTKISVSHFCYRKASGCIG